MTVLGRRYELTTFLGEGGEAVVFRCREPLTGRQFAARIPKPPFDWRARRRLLRETVRLIRCAGPGVIEVAAYHEEQGVPILFLELAEGGDLRSHIEAGTFRNPLRALYVVRDVAGTLGRIHRQGFAHRDLKPSNILLNGEREPIVADFGLATTVGMTLTHRGGFVGTLAYAPPEQADGQYGPVNDVYPLGLMLYEMVTGYRLEDVQAVPSAELWWPNLLGDSFMQLVYRLSHRHWWLRPQDGSAAYELIEAERRKVETRVWQQVMELLQ